MAWIMFILLIIIVLVVLYLALFEQDCFLMLFSLKYHLLYKISKEYNYCISQVPPFSEEYFFDRVATILQEDKSCDDEFKRQIKNMLSRREFYDYFLRGNFTIERYREMLADYRTGDYIKRPYQLGVTIMSVIPIEIATCPDVVKALEMMILLGWLDEKCQIVEKSQKNPNGREKNEVYYAAQRICEEYGILSYDKIFGKLWNVSDSTIRNSISKAMDGGSGSNADERRKIKRENLNRYIDVNILKKLDYKDLMDRKNTKDRKDN